MPDLGRVDADCASDSTPSINSVSALAAPASTSNMYVVAMVLTMTDPPWMSGTIAPALGPSNSTRPFCGTGHSSALWFNPPSMFQPLEGFIGLRYLRSRRRRGVVSFMSAASLIGIALGVAALLVILSVMNGLETETRNRLLSM